MILRPSIIRRRLLVRLGFSSGPYPLLVPCVRQRHEELFPALLVVRPSFTNHDKVSFWFHITSPKPTHTRGALVTLISVGREVVIDGRELRRKLPHRKPLTLLIRPETGTLNELCTFHNARQGQGS